MAIRGRTVVGSAAVLRLARWALLGGPLLALWFSTALGRVVPLGPVLPVSTVQTLGQTPQVVTLPDGGFVVVWSGTGGTFGQPPAEGRHFDATDHAVGAQFEFQGVTGDCCRLIVASGDGLVLSWPGDGGLVLGRFTADGIAAGTPQPIAGSAVASEGPALAVTPQNEFVVVWNGLGPALIGQRFDADLTPVGPNFLVNDGPNGSGMIYPGIGTTSAGGFVVAWPVLTFGGYGIFEAPFDAHDLPVGSTIAAVEPNEFFCPPPSPPSVCVYPSGDFVVSWADEIYHPIAYRRFTALMEPVTDPLYTALGSLGSSLSLACLSQENIVVSGFAYHFIGSGTQVIGRAFDVQNRPIGQVAVPVDGATNGAAVAPLSDDSFVAAWTNCTGMYATPCDVFAQRFTLSGTQDCPGDCNGDGVVTIDEVLTAVSAALNTNLDDPAHCLQTQACPAIDTDLNCEVTIDEILAAVNNALKGCP